MTGKYQAYPEYKESRVEWLGDVPSSWCVSRLAYIFTKANAGEVIDKTYWGGGGEVLYTCNRTPLQSDYLEFPEEKRTEQNDLLLTRNGTPYVHKPKLGSIYSNVVQRITVENDFDRDYLMHCLGNSARNLKGYGVSIESLNFDNWKSLSFAYPAKSEQIRVVKFLDHETAKIDTLIEKQQQLIKLLKEKRQAVISHAVTKGLNPYAPMRDSGVEWLGEVPEHWVVAQLKFNTLEMQTGPFGSQLHAEDYVNDGTPLINPAHMIEGEIIPDTKVTVDEETKKRLIRHKLSEGEIIFARRGEMGRCAIVTKYQDGWLCGTGSLKAKLNERLIPEYAYLLITSDGVVSELSLESKGSTMDNLNTETLGRVRIQVPPTYEQNQILQYVGGVSGTYELLISNAEKAITLMKERRTALISAAVTGKIDVRNWQAPQPSNKSNNNYKEVAA